MLVLEVEIVERTERWVDLRCVLSVRVKFGIILGGKIGWLSSRGVSADECWSFDDWSLSDCVGDCLEVCFRTDFAVGLNGGFGGLLFFRLRLVPLCTGDLLAFCVATLSLSSSIALIMSRFLWSLSGLLALSLLR